ncbi:hypothetical protein NQ318_019510 [Aromia moschata]|uniref:Uncharacterized protein n=1 Tax=Aromia moschata TaxID=1265417 RepID=A0AAV8XZI7_9CUCU|nr:hypothetical protein NQ318_019510 [Aromia moschata]
MLYLRSPDAGIGKRGNLHDGDIKDWESVFKINVLGLCIATREAIKDMKSISPGLVDTEMIPPHMKTDNFYKEGKIIGPGEIVDGVVYALSTPPSCTIQELTIRPLLDLVISNGFFNK